MKKITLILVLIMLGAGLPFAYAKPPAVNLDQVRNGPASSPYNPIQWHNGNLNSQHSHYVEGYSVPYRAIMTDLPTDGTVITLTIGYDIKDQGKHALDYLTHYDYIDDPSHSTTFGHSQELIDPLLGVTVVSATTSTYAIPVPSSSGSPVTDQPTNSFLALPAGKNLITLFGGTISNVVYTDEGILTAAHDEARVSITFTVDSSTAVLAWGGHIASREDWGFEGSEARSAGEINGSPYHMRLIDWNLNNLGNQDRSLKIVEPTVAPGTIIVEKQTDPDGDTESFEFTSNTLGSFTLEDGESITHDGLDPGIYDVSETVPSGWTLTGVTVSDGSPIGALDLSSEETITVTFTNTKSGSIIVRKEVELGKSSEYSNIVFEFDPSWSGENFFLGNGDELEIPLEPGDYSVRELNFAGFNIVDIIIEEDGITQAPSADTAFVSLEPGETIEITFVNSPPTSVIPETPLGTIGTLLTFAAAAAVVMAMRKGLPAIQS